MAHLEDKRPAVIGRIIVTFQRQEKRLWLLAVLLHLMGLILYLDWREILTNPPVSGTDFATHWAQVWSVSHYLDQGHLWGYDPYFLAGQPEGTGYDADNKLFEIASWLLHQTSLPLPLSYNLVLATFFLLAPLAVYPAARWFGLDRGAAFLAQAAALGLWYLDPIFRWGWQGGTFAFILIVYLSWLVVAAAVRLFSGPPQKTAGPYLAWFGLGPLLFWLHGLAFFLLLVPLALVALSQWRSLDRRGRLFLTLWPPLVVLLNLPWLLPLLRFLWAQTGTAAYLQGGLPALAADLLGIGYVDGASSPDRLAVRWLVLAVGGLGLWQLWRSRNHSLTGRTIGVTVAVAFLAAYGARHLPGGGNLQPYRYIEQAALWSTIGLAEGLYTLVGWFGRPAGRSWRRGLALLFAAAAIFWLAKSGWQFRPPLLGGPAQNRWQGPSADAKAICQHLKTLPPGGRILLDDFRLAALLPWCSGREVIGGPFAHVFTQYGYANANITEFLGRPYRDYAITMWQEAITTYYIGSILVYQDWGIPDWYTLADWLADHPDQATAGPTFGPYRLYQVNSTLRPLGVVADYSGLYVQADPAAPGYLLPYHWLPTLRSQPATVQLRPQSIGDDPIPFIYVEPNGVANFTIYNYTGYR